MIKILDGVALVDPRQGLLDGFHAQLGYLAGNNVITRTWIDACTRAAFGVGSLCELDPQRVLGGENAGVADAKMYVAIALALNQPRGSALYASCDMDPAAIPGGPAGAIPYYRGWSLVRRSGYLAGAYIGAAGANDLLAAGVVDRIFIPSATSWSDGQTPRREDMLQLFPQVVIGGESYDVDEANAATAGLWNGHGLWPQITPPPPKPKPTETHMDALRVSHSADRTAFVLVNLATLEAWTFADDTEANYYTEHLGVKVEDQPAWLLARCCTH